MSQSRSTRSKPTRRSQTWRKGPKRQTNNIDGMVMRVSDDPPATQIQPWSSLIVVISRKVDGQKDYLWLGDIVTALRRQIDGANLMLNQGKASVGTWKSSDFQLDMKLDWVQAWGIDGKNIVCNFWDPTSSSHNDPTGKAVAMQTANILSTIYDTGTQSRNPRLGFKYPERVRNSPFTVGDLNDTKTACNWNDDTARLFLSYQSFQGKSILFHVHIYYRPPGIGKVTFTRELQEDIFEKVAENSNTSGRMAEILQQLKEVLVEIKKSQPSTLEKTLKGVKYAAMAVAPFIGVESEGGVDDEQASSSSPFGSLDGTELP